MKCPHCGVHFDDSETRCPFCGCRVSGSKRGSHEKKDCKINTDTGFFREKKEPKQTFTQDQTFTQKFTTQKKKAPKQPKKQPIFTQPQNSGKGRKKAGCGIILAVIILISVLTSFLGNLSYRPMSFTEKNFPEATEDYIAGFAGSYNTSDGRQLTLDEENNFTLTENAATYSGYYDVSDWDADFYSNSYPIESYTGYELYISFDEGGTPMPDGDDYAFYEIYILDDDPNTLIVCNYEDSESDVTFTRLDAAA